MFDNYVNAEKMSSFMRTNALYPAELVQAIPLDIQNFCDDIGGYNFDTILRDLSKAVRNNKSAVDDSMNLVRTLSPHKDAERLSLLQSLELLILEAKQKLHQEYFPYELTRTPAKACLCYRKLNAMQMAEYASELMFGTYSRPNYLTADAFLTDDYILSKLAGGISDLPKPVDY